MSRTPKTFRILGIDPGSRATGYGIIDQSGNRTIFISCGVIRPNLKKTFSSRLLEIHSGISEVIETFSPDRVAIEDVFVSINPGSALKLGHARGVLLLAAMQHHLEIHEYSARKVKQAVVGYGQASKEQIQQVIRVLLNLSATPSQDAADGLAIALCCANHVVFS